MARRITGLAKRSICAIPMRTASNFTGIARPKSGLGLPLAQWKCSRARSISTACALKQSLKAEISHLSRPHSGLRQPGIYHATHQYFLSNIAPAVSTRWPPPSHCGTRSILERAFTSLGKSQAVDTALLQRVSPLAWEHVGLTGDYLWTPISKWPRAASARSGLPEPDSAVLNVCKFPIFRVPEYSELSVR